MIGSANGRSADTYAVTSRDERSRAAQPHTVIVAAIVHAIWIRRGRLFGPIHEIVELRDAVRLGPDIDFPRLLERLVVPLEGLLAVECDREMTRLELDAERVPLARRHGHSRPLLLGTAAVDGMVDRHVVLERVRTGDVVVVRILRTPHDA